MDIVKALGTKFYGMTRRQLTEAVGIELGGTFSKILDNLHESGITREYPRYGKERVETVYQLKDFFSMFYLHFTHGKGTDAGNWRVSIQLVMVTTNGITQNAHTKDVNQQITLDDLF